MRTGSQAIAFGWSSLFMLLFLAGCGGGGGGGGGGGVTALTYSGNTNQATVTGTNASRLTANVFGSSDTAEILAGTSIESGRSERNVSGGLTSVARTLNHATRRALTGANRGSVSGLMIDQTVPCDNGIGTVRTAGTINDITLTGTLTLTYNGCLAEGLTMSGTVQVQVLEFDPFTCGGFVANFIGSTSRFTLRGSGVSIDAGGSLQVVTNIVSFPTATETVINNLVSLNNLTGAMTKAENLASTGMLGSVCIPASIGSLAFNGRIFDNVHGYTDVSTITPLQISLPQPFPTTGEIRLAGNASALHVTALSSTRVQLQFDTNADNAGDGFAALMNWTDLSGPVGADIGDTDGDGMHNSWETANPPMNPNLNDASTDNDGVDGNNLAEYQNGTNPNVAGM